MVENPWSDTDEHVGFFRTPFSFKGRQANTRVDFYPMLGQGAQRLR